jgi:hypothetical protein
LTALRSASEGGRPSGVVWEIPTASTGKPSPASEPGSNALLTRMNRISAPHSNQSNKCSTTGGSACSILRIGSQTDRSMAEARSELPPEGSRFPIDGRTSRSGASSSPGVLRPRQSLRLGAASPVPLTRREFEAARLKALVNQAARRVGPSTGGETRGPRRCPRCGAANDHAARYCDQCGGHLHSSPAPVVGFAAAVRAAIARDEKASATRLAAGEGISEIEALRRVRNKSRKGGHRRQFGS